MTASFGERLSALILAAYLKRFHPSELADARDFVRTDDQFTHAVVNFPVTNRTIRARFSPLLANGARPFRSSTQILTRFTFFAASSRTAPLAWSSVVTS